MTMMRAARFPLPKCIDKGPVTIWRGCRGYRTAHQDDLELAWTLDRDVACWLAMDWAGSWKGAPTVLRATCRRRDIVYYNNSQHESAVIPAKIGDVTVDSEWLNWHLGHDRFLAARDSGHGQEVASNIVQ